MWKRFACFASSFFLCQLLVAQQEYFIFLQSENVQPFYAKIGTKIYSSSSVGHLVVPSLTDSTYAVTIGFPKNKFAEMEFTVAVNGKDNGFQLKYIIDQGWTLNNLLTLQSIKPKSYAKSSTTIGEAKRKTDTYSVLMAGVVNDTAVLYATVFPIVAKVEPSTPTRQSPVVVGGSPVSTTNKKIEVVKTEGKRAGENTPMEEGRDSLEINKTREVVGTLEKTMKDTLELIKETTTKSTPLKKEALLDTAYSNKSQVSRSSITKVSERSAGESLELNYLIVEADKVAETISIRILFDPVTNSPQAPSSPNDKRAIPVDTPAVTKGKKVFPEAPLKLDTVENRKIPMVNSDCRNFASEQDVDKLRIKILAEKNDKEKITAAKKYYKNKCFSSKQIRALSELFYLEEGKFEFLSASYPFVSDSENYRKLVGLLNDQLFVNKFNSLFRN